jgi:4-alpha-glucanotransferase
VPENSVAYTGTHDNDTTRAWWELTTDAARDRALAAARDAGIEEDEPSWLIARLALASRARTAIVPVQDLLGLDNSARMNTPGREDGNWAFRLQPGALDDALAARLRKATRAAGR